MNDLFSNSQQTRKPAVTSKGGIVAAQSRKAAEVGAAVLAAGGDGVGHRDRDHVSRSVCWSPG